MECGTGSSGQRGSGQADFHTRLSFDRWGGGGGIDSMGNFAGEQSMDGPLSSLDPPVHTAGYLLSSPRVMS